MRPRAAAAVLCLLPQAAAALDMEYYTYGGFQITRDAWARLALVFGDHGFITLFTSVAILGMLSGAMAAIWQAVTRGRMGPLDWITPTVAGSLVFAGVILPKGTLHLYDPIANKYEPIGGIPDAVVFAAGTTNLLERGIADITASASAYPYADEAGGIAFRLLKSASRGAADVGDYYLLENVGRYFSDCGPMALSSAGFDIDMHRLKRDSTDQMSNLAELASTSAYTVIKSAAEKSGVSMTCAQAWVGELEPALSADATFGPSIDAVCAESGLEPGDPPQLMACKELLGKAAERYGVAGADAVDVVRNIYIAAALERGIGKDAPELAEEILVADPAQGAGSFNATLPTIRAMVTAMVIGSSPFLLLFIVTPIIGKALKLAFGLWLFLATWGVMDVMVHQGAMDAAQAAFSEIGLYKFGLDAIWMTPAAADQAIAGFGSARGQALMLAAAIAAALFGVSSYAFAQMMGSMKAAVEAGAGHDPVPAARGTRRRDLAVDGMDGLSQPADEVPVAHAYGSTSPLYRQQEGRGETGTAGQMRPEGLATPFGGFDGTVVEGRGAAARAVPEFHGLAAGGPMLSDGSQPGFGGARGEGRNARHGTKIMSTSQSPGRTGEMRSAPAQTPVRPAGEEGRSTPEGTPKRETAPHATLENTDGGFASLSYSIGWNPLLTSGGGATVNAAMTPNREKGSGEMGEIRESATDPGENRETVSSERTRKDIPERYGTEETSRAQPGVIRNTGGLRRDTHRRVAIEEETGSADVEDGIDAEVSSWRETGREASVPATVEDSLSAQGPEVGLPHGEAKSEIHAPGEESVVDASDGSTEETGRPADNRAAQPDVADVSLEPEGGISVQGRAAPLQPKSAAEVLIESGEQDGEIQQEKNGGRFRPFEFTSVWGP